MLSVVSPDAQLKCPEWYYYLHFMIPFYNIYMVICDSWWGFEFSRLNSLLSWAFSQQDKIKIIEIINGSVTFKEYESYQQFEHWTMLIMFLFLVLIVSILFTIELINLKKSYPGIFEKHDHTSINLGIWLYRLIFKLWCVWWN